MTPLHREKLVFQPKVSVAMATFNGEDFLSIQLESILHQSLLPNEVIIFDDNSGDRTMSLLLAFRDVASFQVRIYQNDATLGSVRNFEKAISRCIGDIVVLADQDDIWVSDRIKRTVRALVADEAAGYVFSDAFLVDASSRAVNGSLWDRVGFTPKRRRRFADAGLQAKELLRKPAVTGATLAFRRDCVRHFLPFPADLRSSLHHDAWIALVLSSAGRYGIALAEPLIHYRLHNRQQIGAQGGDEVRRKFMPSQLGLVGELKILAMVRDHSGVGATEFESRLGVHFRHIEARLRVTQEGSVWRRVLIAARHLATNPTKYSLLSVLKDVLR